MLVQCAGHWSLETLLFPVSSPQLCAKEGQDLTAHYIINIYLNILTYIKHTKGVTLNSVVLRIH